MRTRTLLLALMTLPVAGCSNSWKSTFVPSPGAESGLAPLTPDAPVRVREVDWERLQTAIGEMRASAAASDVPVSEWSEAEKATMKSTLLRALQVTADPAGVVILGRSDFRTTQTLRPETTDQPELVSFARAIGADEVVWSRGYMGRAQTIINEPVNSWYYGNESYWDSRNRRWRTRSYSDQSTTFIPVQVEADQYAYIAYFLAAKR